MSLMRFHHLGVAVRAIDKAITVYQDVFGYHVLSGPFDDPLQRVSVCFVGCEDPDEVMLELVAPLGQDSPISNILEKGIGAYHACYEVDDIQRALAYVRQKRCTVLSRPTPAAAFSGRRIAWFHTRTNQLVELLERSTIGSDKPPPGTVD